MFYPTVTDSTTCCVCARRPSPLMLCLIAAAIGSLLTTGRLTAQIPIADSLPLPFVPLVRFDPDFGILLGGRAVLHGRTVAEGGVATSGRFLFASQTDLVRLAPNVRLGIDARISGITPQRFYGFGNATTADRPSGYYRTGQYQYRVEPRLTISPTSHVDLSVGPILGYTRTGSELDDPDDLDDRNIVWVTRPYGAGWFGQLGAQARVSLDTRSPSTESSAALQLSVGGSAYPAVLDATAPFGELDGVLAGVASLPLPTTPTFAVRLGAKMVWGAVPLHEVAYLGGSRSLRGYGRQRFAGDAAAYGGAELRVPVGRIDILGPMTYGVLGLADAGRVSYRGESPGGWHTALGGGVWISPASVGSRLCVTVVRSGERVSVHVGAGFPY